MDSQSRQVGARTDATETDESKSLSIEVIDHIISYLPYTEQYDVSIRHRTILHSHIANLIGTWWKTNNAILKQAYYRRLMSESRLAKRYIYLNMTISNRAAFVSKWISVIGVDECLLWYLIDASSNNKQKNKQRRYGINNAMIYILNKSDIRDVLLYLENLKIVIL